MTVSGVLLEGSADAFITDPRSNNYYQSPVSARRLYPGFAEGDTVRPAADGDVFRAFTVHAPGIDPLTLTGDTQVTQL